MSLDQWKQTSGRVISNISAADKKPQTLSNTSITAICPFTVCFAIWSGYALCFSSASLKETNMVMAVHN